MNKPTIYNEENYLFNEEALQSFKDMYHERLIHWSKEKKDYRKTLKKYDKFIGEVAKFIKELGYHSCLDCSLILSYLIHHGYLSKDMVFKSGSYEPSTEISSRLGTSILTGMGCCRNVAGLQEDVFHELGIQTEPFYCYEGANLFHKEANRPANHVINLVFYDHNLYGMDLFNQNRLYSFRTPLILKEDSTHSGRRLRYKPYYEIIMGASVKDIKDKLYQFQDYAKRDVLSPFVFEDEIKYDAKRMMMESEDVLHDFHEKTKSLKREIVEGLHCEEEKKKA